MKIAIVKGPRADVHGDAINSAMDEAWEVIRPLHPEIQINVLAHLVASHLHINISAEHHPALLDTFRSYVEGLIRRQSADDAGGLN